MPKSKNTEAKQIKEKLVGATITKAITSGESFGFEAQKDGKTLKVWIDTDPEGNGPGHLSIE